MNLRVFVPGLVLVGALVAPWALAQPAAAPAEDFFADQRLRTIHIQVSADNWQKMQPTSHPRFDPRRSAPGDAAEAAEKSEPSQVVRSPYGYEYTPVPGKLELDHEPAIDITIRFKGNFSYSHSAGGSRRPMKIDLSRNDDQPLPHGLSTINLNNSAGDRTMMREPIAFALFREAGLAASRTVPALVYLTVDSTQNHQLLGLYTIVEQVDRAFLKRHFGDSSGMLLKPEMLRGIPYLGARWETYVDRYNLKGSCDAQGQKAFLDMMRLIHFGDDAAFRQNIGLYIAVDPFMKFIAMQAMMSNLDSFLTTGHNYFLYRNPGDGKFYWMPWDMDLSFGGFSTIAAPSQQMNLDLWMPHVPPNRLVQRLLAMEPFKEAYQKHVRQLAKDVFTPANLQSHIATRQRYLRQAGASAAAAGLSGSPTTRPAGLGGSASMQSFLAGRFKSIDAQLAGGRGFVPSEDPALAVRHSWGEHRRESLGQSALMALQRTLIPANTRVRRADFHASLQAAFVAVLAKHNGVCDQPALAASLGDVLPVPLNYVFDPGPGPDWATIIFRRADANKDGRLTAQEVAAALARQAVGADTVGETELRNALGELVEVLED